MSSQNLEGRILGQYKLTSLLGRGGMGAVYRGYQLNLDREVAVKVLPETLAAEPGYAERFTREAKTAASLEHRHIVPVYDYGTQDGISYIVMRLLTGGSLEDRLATRGERPLPSLGEVARLLEQIASALDYAHRRNVIHRDIKTSNILFDDEGTPYVADFGLAKLLGTTTNLTGSGVIMGTPQYMAPEVWRGEEATPAADQYALAVLVYVMLTGKLPFDAPTPHAIMYKHLQDMPASPSQWRPEVPEMVTKALNRAMAKEASERYPSAGSFADAFREGVRGLEGTPSGILPASLAEPATPRPALPVTPAAAPVDLEGPTTPLPAHVPPTPTAAPPTPALFSRLRAAAGGCGSSLW